MNGTSDRIDSNRAAATRFAESLDREDYAAAEKMMAWGCEYEIAGRTIRGPTTILADYRDNGDWGNHVFDRVDFSSRVIECGEESALVEFQDNIEHKGRRHTHKCRQRLSFDPDGLILRIENEIDPDASARLAEFFASVGVERSR